MPAFLPRHKYFDWPSDANDLSIEKVRELYENGFAGAKSSPEAFERFKAAMMWPDADGVAHQFGLADTGAGKLVIPFVFVLEMFPVAWPGLQGQARGDCFPAGTMVRMADGSEKPIESIRSGEFVQSHTGKKRRVVDTISKSFDGELVKIKAKGYGRSVEATPDHQFVTYPSLWDKAFPNSYGRWKNRNEVIEWRAIGSLTSDDYVLLSNTSVQEQKEEYVFDIGGSARAITNRDHRLSQPPQGKTRFKHGRNLVNSTVRLDSTLAWLLGLYLAEGSMDYNHLGQPKRVSLSLGSHEPELAEKAKAAFEKVFGVETNIESIPSKPSVVSVRCNSTAVAEVIHELVPGNVYSKEVPKVIFSCSKPSRLAMLRGWMDGDGSFNNGSRSDPRDGKQYANCKLTGVSVSEQLVRGMYDVAASCGLHATWTKRKARNQSKAANDLHLHGGNATKIYPEIPVRTKPRQKDYQVTELGYAAKIQHISQRQFCGQVYCLGVEIDHSFIANGFAVHNCVSWSTRNACLGTLVCDIVSGLPDEKSGKPEQKPVVSAEGIADGVLSTEAFYWYRGYDGDGWHCPDAAMVACKQSGAFLRQNYPDLGVDLTKYSGRIAGLYGRREPPSNIQEVGRQRLVHQATDVNSFEAGRDLLFSGYFISTCGGEGYSDRRDENGVSKQAGSWAHALSYIAYDDRPEIKQKYGEPLVLILNSWARWNSGGRDIYMSESFVPAAKRDLWIKLGIVNPSTSRIMIPEGSFWTPWSHCKRREAIAFSGVNGWPRKDLESALFKVFGH